MGGEPTFVSIDDMDGAEWNTAALGPKKRLLADESNPAAQEPLRPGRVAALRPGQMVSGRILPRWAFACYWRKDGQPVWDNESLFADESKDYGYNEKRAEQFIHALAERLGCAGQWIMPAFEDAWYYLWKERRLPVNVDPFKSRLEEEEERARLAKIFEQGLDKIVGFALPIQRGSPAHPALLAQRPVVLCAPSDVTSSPAIRPWVFVCRWIPCRGSRRTTIPLSTNASPSRNDSPLPPYEHFRQAFVPQPGRMPPIASADRLPGGAGQRPDGASANRVASRGVASPRTGSCARRSASSRATGGCTSSCRRWPSSRITWT